MPSLGVRSPWSSDKFNCNLSCRLMVQSLFWYIGNNSVRQWIADLAFLGAVLGGFSKCSFLHGEILGITFWVFLNSMVKFSSRIQLKKITVEIKEVINYRKNLIQLCNSLMILRNSRKLPVKLFFIQGGSTSPEVVLAGSTRLMITGVIECWCKDD